MSEPLPREEADAPAFAEPWQAQAFAMAVSLSRSGLFTWPEWAECLGRHLAPGDAPYYEAWLAALEEMATTRTALSAEVLAARKQAWADAAAAAPHGEPITLDLMARSAASERPDP